MRIRVEFLGFHFAFEQRELELEFKGNTISDLIKELSKTKKFKEAVLKEDGRIDEEVLIILNGEIQLERENVDVIELKHGDTVTFMLMAGGG